jgi:hypothetical protein
VSHSFALERAVSGWDTLCKMVPVGQAEARGDCILGARPAQVGRDRGLAIGVGALVFLHTSSATSNVAASLTANRSAGWPVTS